MAKTKRPKVYRFIELTEAQQQKVVEETANEMLQFMVETGRTGVPGTQRKVDKALRDAERMQTPWFAGEYIMDYVGRDKIFKEALKVAKRGWYSKTGKWLSVNPY